jgi:heme exporter protein CcmD
MHFDISHALAMGGYAKFVWTAYGITLFVFGINIVVSLREKKQIKKIIQQYLSQHES